MSDINQTQAARAAWDKFARRLAEAKLKLKAIRSEAAENQNRSKIEEIRRRMNKI